MTAPDRLPEIKARRSLVGDHPTREGVRIGDGVLVDLDWLIGEVERLRMPAGPDRCASCGAGPEHLSFDPADGWSCSACGRSDADET